MHGIFTHIWHDFMVNVGKFHTWSIWAIYIYIYQQHQQITSISIWRLHHKRSGIPWWICQPLDLLSLQALWCHGIWRVKPVFSSTSCLVLHKTQFEGGRLVVGSSRWFLGSLQTRCLWITSNRWLALGNGISGCPSMSGITPYLNRKHEKSSNKHEKSGNKPRLILAPLWKGQVAAAWNKTLEVTFHEILVGFVRDPYIGL